MTPTALIREKPVKPGAHTTPKAQQSRRPTAVVTRAELAPCTCPEHCERDHTDE